MPGSKVLVLGATGPAGICLVRELLYRKHQTVAYVRNATKIPADLKSNSLLEVIEGQMDDAEKLETAVAKCNIVLSLLGPNKMRLPEPSPYPGYYATLFPLMRKHSVKRILAMSTLSVSDPLDGFSLLCWVMVMFVRIFASPAYRTVHGIARVFQEEAEGLDWAVYRIAAIPGGHDEESWKKDREDGPTHAGYVAKPGWQIYTKRGALARWLVDCAENGFEQWYGKMPAISRSSIAKESIE